MKSALIENGIVTNIAVGLAEGFIQCGDEVCIGWSYDDQSEVFSAPTPPVPSLAEALESVVNAIRIRMDDCINVGVIWKLNGGSPNRIVKLTPNMRAFLAYVHAAMPSRPGVHGGKIYQDGAEFSIDDDGVVELAIFAISWGLKIKQISLGLTVEANGMTLEDLLDYDADNIDWTVTWDPGDQGNGWDNNIVKQTP